MLKITKRILPVLAGMLFSALTAQSQDRPEKLDLYILIGQSNMAGRGPITSEFADEHDEHVYMFTRKKQWVVARHPLHFDKPKIDGVGPGLSFGITMSAASPSHKIGLIPCAVGGTPIEYWLPGAYDKATNTHPYDEAVDRIKSAMKYGTIKGVVWHQGEANSQPDRAKIYLDQLTALISRIRELTGNPYLPFVAGELAHYRQQYNNINMELKKLPATVEHTAVASAEGLVHKGDSTHFDSPSARELGRRMAKAMLMLQPAETKEEKKETD